MLRNALLIVAGILVSGGWSVAQGQGISHVRDHVLNEKGQGRITLFTGIPYVGLVEYAHGVSNRVTAGVFAGTTPTVEAVGVRGRVVLHQPGDGFRIYYCTPIVFYPKTEGLGGDPWWLVRPNLNIEWMTPGGFRYKVGGSVIAAASHHTLFGDPAKAKFDAELWNAVHGGVSFPIGGNATFQLEASLVMDGLRIAGDDWIGGPPVILVLGTSWTL